MWKQMTVKNSLKLFRNRFNEFLKLVLNFSKVWPVIYEDVANKSCQKNVKNGQQYAMLEKF